MTRENSKILIAAAGGKVGHHVVTQLAQKKVPARAGVHSQTRPSALRESVIETAVLDFENSNSLAAAFKGIDRLFLVTPGSPDQGHYEESILAEATNTTACLRIRRFAGRRRTRCTSAREIRSPRT